MENTSILVFGKDGQVGKAFQKILGNHPKVTWIGRSDCDLSHPSHIQETLEKFQPQIILNAAAYTAVDQAENESELAFLINGVAPGVMAAYMAKKEHGTLVHYSTDYVFDGSKTSPYVETDATNPLGQYGKSKLAGELAIEKAFLVLPQSTAKYVILRTSWVYGDGGNFIKTMLRLAKDRAQLKVIADQWGVPSSAQWLAQIACQFVKSAAPSGIYHAVTDGETSWHGLATFAIQTALMNGVHLQAKPEAIIPIPATEYPLPAPRPYNSRMSNQKLKEAMLKMDSSFDFPSWQNQVADYIRNII
jgi:dTDP-4-dehydrorhamnose reductase